MNRLKKILAPFLVLGVALVVIGFIANLVVDNPYSQKVATQFINEQLRNFSNVDIKFNAVRLTAAPPTIELFGVAAFPTGQPNKELFSAAKLRVRLSVWQVLVGQLKISVIELIDPIGTWPPPWDFPGFLKESSTGGNGEIKWPPSSSPPPVERIIFRNAQIYAEFPKATVIPKPPVTMIASAAGVDIDLEIDDWSQISLEAKIQSLNASEDESSLLEDASVELELELDRNRLGITELTVKGERIDLRGKGYGNFEKRNNSLLERFSLRLDVAATSDLSMLGSYLELAATQGETRIEAAIDLLIPFASTERPTLLITGESRVVDGIIDEFRLFNTDTKFKMDLDGITFDTIGVHLGDQLAATGSGYLGFDDPIAIVFDAEIKDLALRDLLNAFNVHFELFDFTLNSNNLKLRGQGDPFFLDVQATTRLKDTSLPKFDAGPGPPNCAGPLQLHATEKGLTFRQLALKCEDDSELLVGGSLPFNDLTNMELDVKATNLDLGLAARAAHTPITGKANIVVKVGGNYDLPKVSADVQAADLAVAEMKFGTTTGNIEILGDQIAWKDVHSSPPAGGGIHSPSGSIKIDAPYLSTITARATQLPNDIILGAAKFADLSLSAELSHVDVKISGPLLRPLLWEGEYRLGVNRVTYEDQLFADSVNIEALATEKGWQVTQFNAELGAIAVESTIKHTRKNKPSQDGGDDLWHKLGIHPQDGINIALRVGPRTAGEISDHFQSFPYIGKTLAAANISAQFIGAAKLEGDFTNLQGTLEGQLARPKILGATLAPIKFSGFVDGADLDIIANQAGNALKGRLNVNILDPKLPYQWYLNFNRFDARFALGGVFAQDARNFCYVNGDWTMKGDFKDFWRSSGSIELEGLRLSYLRDIGAGTQRVRMDLPKAVKVEINDRGWNIVGSEAVLLSGAGLVLNLKTQNNHPPDRLHTTIWGEYDISDLRRFSTQIESAAGKIDFNLEVTGSTSNPSFNGSMQSKASEEDNIPLAFGLADARPRLNDIVFDLRIVDTQIYLDRFSASKGNGSIIANGQIDFSEGGGSSSRIDITLRDAAVAYQLPVLKTFDTTVNGSIAILGNKLPLRVAGDIAVVRARSTREIDITDEIIKSISRQSINVVTVAQQPYVEFDLNLLADKSISVQNQTVQALVSSNLRIEGTDVAPRISGQVDVDRGKITYKRDFTINRGVILFDDPVRNDPNLDFVAVAPVQNYRVYVTVSGRSSNPQFDVSIDPPTRDDGTPISKVDIIVLLNRGSLPDASRTLGDTRGTAQSETFNLMFGLVGEPIEKILGNTKKTTIVRSPYIDFYPSEDGNTVPRINVPLNLGEDIDLTARFGTENRKVSGEYSVNESISTTFSLEQQIDESTKSETESKLPLDAAVDLKFGFSFD